MTLMRLIYASHPFGFDDLALSGILTTAQRNNLRDGITGTLICREDLYMQLLEGDRPAVEAAFDGHRACSVQQLVAVVLQGTSLALDVGHGLRYTVWRYEKH